MQVDSAIFRLFAWCARTAKRFNKKGPPPRNELLQVVRTVSGDQIVPSGVYYSPMPIIGIQPLSIEDILRPHSGTINEIIQRSGLSTTHAKYNPTKLITDVIERVAEYIHLLPASEDYHHTETGGLLSHSLEVAKIALGEAYNIDLPSKTYPDLETIRRTRYFYAVFVAALLHDVGKVFSDIRVTCVDKNTVWAPHVEPLTTWALKNKVASYQVEYKRGRGRSHERAANYITMSVLSTEAREYLSSCKTDNLYMEIDEAISHYAEREEYISLALRRADSASTLKDIQGRHVKETGRREFSLATLFIRACQRLTADWTCNTKGAMLWLIGGDVFIAYTQAIEAIMEEIRSSGVSIPTDVNEIYNRLIEQHIIESLDKETRSVFWSPGHFTEDEARQIQEDLLINRINRPWLSLVKLKSVNYAYGSVVLPESQPGLMCLNKGGDMMLYRKGSLYQPVILSAEEMHKRRKELEEKAKAEAEATQAEKEKALQEAVKEALERERAAQAANGHADATGGGNPDQIPVSEYNYPLFDYEHEYLEESGALWDDYAAMNQSVYENTDANGPQSSQDSEDDDADTDAAGNESDAAESVSEAGKKKRARSRVKKRLAERADGSEQLPDDDELDADDETPPPPATSNGGMSRKQKLEAKRAAKSSSEPEVAVETPDTPVQEVAVNVQVAQPAVPQDDSPSPATPEQVVAEPTTPTPEPVQSPKPAQAPRKASGQDNQDRARQWLSWCSAQRNSGVLMYRTINDISYLRVGLLAKHLLKEVDEVIETLAQGKTIQATLETAASPDRCYVVMMPNEQGQQEECCQLSIRGQKIMAAVSEPKREEPDRREFVSVFERLQRGDEEEQVMAVVETESTGNAVLPASPPAPSSVEDKDPAPTPVTQVQSNTPESEQESVVVQDNKPTPDDDDDFEEEDEDMDEEEINQSALSAALHPIGYRWREISDFAETMKRLRWGRGKDRDAMMETDEGFAIRSSYFRENGEHYFNFPLSELKEFRKKIDGKWYYVVPREQP